jgi:hypothetical protein
MVHSWRVGQGARYLLTQQLPTSSTTENSLPFTDVTPGLSTNNNFIRPYKTKFEHYMLALIHQPVRVLIQSDNLGTEFTTQKTLTLSTQTLVACSLSLKSQGSSWMLCSKEECPGPLYSISGTTPCQNSNDYWCFILKPKEKLQEVPP